jgi:predicted aspartyl protease
MIEFEYRYEKGSYYPIIELILEYKGQKIKTDAIVDSGASINIFKSDIAKAIGIDFKHGERRVFQAASAKLIGYVHLITITIGSHKINCKVAFSDDLQTSFNLLGRETIFDKFLIIFDEKKKKIIFNPV